MSAEATCFQLCTCGDGACARPTHQDGQHVCGACAVAWAQGLTT
jgi:hypothetical protein